MRTIWHSLAWKEWHEHKWKLAALTAVLCGVNVLPLMDGPHDARAGCYLITLLSAIPLAFFIGASAVAGERARRTAPFIQALPAPLWKVALPKMLWGLATLVAAISIAFAFIYCWHSARHETESFLAVQGNLFSPQIGVGNWFVSGAITISAVAASIFLWTVAIGANTADEVSAGAKAMLGMVGWWTLLAILGKRAGEQWFDTHKLLVASLITASPAGALVGFPKWQSLVAYAGSTTPLIFGLAFHVGLAATFLIRFGRASGARYSWKPSPLKAQELARLNPPWRSQFAALAWKQFRESGPIVLTGLAGVAGITALWAISQQESHIVVVVEAFSGICLAVGFLVTLVVGIGVSWSDAEPKMNHFWRSRPINPDLWYWTKFVAGLLVLVCSLFSPAAFSAAFVPQDSHFAEVVLALVGAGLAVYIAAVAVTQIVRRPIYSAILSIATLYAGFFAVWLFVSGVDRLLAHQSVFQSLEEYPSVPLMTAGLIAVAIAVLLIGWLAVRYDWGRKN